MVFKINTLHFVSKTFTFNKVKDKQYAEYLDSIAAMSQKDLKAIHNGKFLNPFIDMFFSKNGSNSNQKVTVYHQLDDNAHTDNENVVTNISDCYSSDFALFYLKEDIFSLFWQSRDERDSFLDEVARLFDDFKDGLFIFYEAIKNSTKLPPGFDSGLTKQLINDLKSIRCSNLVDDKLRLFKSDCEKSEAIKLLNSFYDFYKDVLDFKNGIKKIENLYFINQDIDDHDSYKEYKKMYEKYSELRASLIFLELSLWEDTLVKRPNKKYIEQIVSFVLVSKEGIVNFGFICPSFFDISNMSNIAQIAHDINIKTNTLVELTSFLNDVREKGPDFLKKTFFSEFCYQGEEPTRKAVYMSFLFNKNKKEQYNNIFFPKRVFDYISLVVAYERSFTDNYLFDFSKDMNSIIQFKGNNKIIDYANGETEHIFFDDNLFTHAVLNTGALKIGDSKDEESNQYFTSFKVSHRSKFYSLWDFQCICEAISYGSIAIRIYKMFVRYVTLSKKTKRCKLSLLYLYHRVLKIAADILGKYDLKTFPTKNNAFYLSKVTFERIGATEMIEAVEKLLDNGWKDGNLITSQSYNRYSLFLSLGSLSVSLFSFGMISKIYVDGYYISSSNSMRQPSSSWFGLLLDAFKTPKMWLVTLLCFLPFIAFLILEAVESCRIRHFKLIKEYNKIILGKNKK